MQAQVKITGLKETTDALSNFGESLQNLVPFLKAAGLVMLESSQRNFMAGGRPGWAPLTPATIRRRRGQGTPEPLRDTGVLMTSLAPLGADVFRLTPLSVEAGTNVPYAGYHQLGIGVPARPFLMLQPEDEETILNIALEEVKNKAKESGL